MFQHTATRRRLVYELGALLRTGAVSTHSRPKAAGTEAGDKKAVIEVSTHSRPKAAGSIRRVLNGLPISFNTQPPEGGWTVLLSADIEAAVSTHSRPKAAGNRPVTPMRLSFLFQHTAARRRLAIQDMHVWLKWPVSTHSRPKAAGSKGKIQFRPINCFNTQPPEGGWTSYEIKKFPSDCFNTQPPEGGWETRPIA